MDLENRLAMAQLLNELLKQDSLIKFGNKKADDKLRQDTETYVKKHLHNLLLNVMGEKSLADFNEEEVAILKAFVTKLKGTTPAAGVQP